MEDYGDMATPINRLKEVGNTDTDIDYDMILQNLNNSEININNDNMRPKRAMNANNFVRSLESDLDTFKHTNEVNLNEPLPINFTKEMVPMMKLVPEKPVEKVEIVQVEKKEEPLTLSNKISLYLAKLVLPENRHILISILLFMLLNNKFIIEFIYDRIPFMNTIESPYPNLILRSIIFGLTLYLIQYFFNK